MAVGNIQSHEDVNAILAAGRADLCAIARGFLADPFLVQREAAARKVASHAWPPQHLAVKGG